MSSKVQQVERGRPWKYPWDKWLNGQSKRVRLVKGKHFDCETRSFELLARRQAAKMGVDVTVHVRGLEVTLEIT